MSVWPLLLVSVPLCIYTRALERIELRADHALTCGQGIIHCEVKSGGPTCIQDDEHVYVSSLDAYIVQCQKQQTWSLCLKVLVNVTVTDADQPVTGDGSGDEEAEEMHGGAHQEDLDNMTSAFAVRVCYTYSSQSHSSMLRFTVRSSAFDDSTTLQVWMSFVVNIPKAELGNFVLVHSSYSNSNKRVILPSEEEACSKGLDAIFCKAPKLHKKTDNVTGAMILYVANADQERFQEFNACQKLDRKGPCVKVEWKNASHEFKISLSSVAPCLCFEIWGQFLRREYCPFLNETAVSGSSVSMSLAENKTRHKQPALVWSLSAPCRLEAQLWLCRKGSGLDSRCHAVNSRSHVHTRLNDSWKETDHRHWQLEGEFLLVDRHPSLCMQVKVAGMDGYLGPVCPFEGERDHWSVPLVLCALLVCLSVLAAYAVQGTLKSCVFRWLKVDDVKPVAGGVEVLLVCPPNADCAVAELVCRQCSSLCAVGFSVSLDLWSRSEISALGPVPWLHSCLDRVQQCGGKAVLVLTQAACEWAEEWGCRVAQRKPEEERKRWVNRGVQSLTCSEVFDASLSCILADYLLGRAGERFILVRFDGQSPAKALPEFFRELPLFSLPSQSLDFIMELRRGAGKRQRVSEHWVRAVASRAVSRSLRGLPQDSVEPGAEEAWETVPLQADQSSPALLTKTRTEGWV
ncbi:interleukin-17 receptor C-like isoform X2 [Sinocyclocheilus rhinocerous]|uniref:interleukin-17 receptor C-like isoform X2 n=1 Tax=Sinocyclocheilus rhinocerous TaxID=307959 RepID=UPI0007B8C7D9|nr:PREDICTED: interleukin-17 receptor C-like isoform X2 [Sinocyclocheilus rhinocerous]